MTTEKKSELILRGIKKNYDSKQALLIDNITFTKGKCYAILGENGSGKSTLLQILAGVIQSDSGEIIGRENFRFGYLPQNPYIFDYNVWDNVSLCINGQNKMCDVQYAVKDALEKVGLIGLEKHKATTLSGGEAQRLALARLVINNHDILLLDEPSSATDIVGREKIEKTLLDYKKEHSCMIIFSSHSPGQASRMADEIIFLQNGRIIEKGETNKILYHSDSEYVRKFLEHWTL